MECIGTIAALAASPDKCAAQVERRAAALASCDAASYWAETAPIAPEVAQEGKRSGWRIRLPSRVPASMRKLSPVGRAPWWAAAARAGPRELEREST